MRRSKSGKAARVLAVDPGRRVGVAVLERRRGRVRCLLRDTWRIDYMCEAEADLAERIENVLRKYGVSAVVIERQFRNRTVIERAGMIRGICMATLRGAATIVWADPARIPGKAIKMRVARRVDPDVRDDHQADAVCLGLWYMSEIA